MNIANMSVFVLRIIMPIAIIVSVIIKCLFQGIINLSVIVLNMAKLSVILFSVIRLSVVMPNVIRPSVLAPNFATNMSSGQ